MLNRPKFKLTPLALLSNPYIYYNFTTQSAGEADRTAFYYTWRLAFNVCIVK